MKKLIVCGDSYMSPVVGTYSGTHFSEIIAEKLGYELIAYSRGGMSNTGIAIQVHTALNYSPKPDLILVGTTYFDRLEWPYSETRPIENLSILDIAYKHECSLSSSYHWLNKNPKLVSTSLADIFLPPGNIWGSDFHSVYGDKFLTERLDALLKYFEYLYHPDLKEFIDTQVIYSMYHKLHFSNIPYLICIEQIREVGESCSWLDKRNYARPDIDIILADSSQRMKGFTDPGYHCPVEGHAEIAELLLSKYIPNLMG